MKMTQIRTIAKKWNINPIRMNKTDLIRRIQTAEGNFACFRTAEKDCTQKDCLWLDDCIGKNAEQCVEKCANPGRTANP